MTGAILQKSGQGAACGGAAGASSVIRLRSRAASRPTPWRFYRLLGKAAGEGARRRGSGRGSRAFAKRKTSSPHTSACRPRFHRLGGHCRPCESNKAKNAFVCVTREASRAAERLARGPLPGERPLRARVFTVSLFHSSGSVGPRSCAPAAEPLGRGPDRGSRPW